MTDSVIVIDYDPMWPLVFERLRSRVWPAVRDFAIGIEHVGSTSVVGLAAKPVIDIDVVVSTRQNVERAIEALVPLGYSHRGNLGIQGREAFSRPPELPAHNLYVCLDSSIAFRNHLAVRDYLRANPMVANEYGELKKQLANRFCNDIDKYIDGKTSFLVGLLREQGFETEALSSIEVANRVKPAK